MTDYHEPPEQLSDSVRDFHRALTSLKEEIEAVDWYSQRAAVCADAELRAVIEHNRDEEIEHACMTLEWLRRNSSTWDANLREYLFRDGSIVGAERDATGGGDAVAPRPHDRTLQIGSLKED